MQLVDMRMNVNKEPCTALGAIYKKGSLCRKLVSNFLGFSMGKIIQTKSKYGNAVR